MWVLIFVVAGALACAVEIVVVYVLLSQPPDYSIALWIHAATVSALSVWTGTRLRRGWPDELEPSREVTWQVLLTTSVALVGPVGAIATLIGVAIYQRFKRTALPFSDWYGQLFPEHRITLAERIHEELTRTVEQQDQDGTKVVPFMDIIVHGTRTQKRVAIAMMSRAFQPDYAQPLREALKDTDSGVRVQAATAIATIENRFLEDSLRIEGEMGESPAAQSLLDAARHYDRYAFSGLLDEDRERRNRESALRCYRQYVEAEPEDMDARIAVGRLLLRDGQDDESCEWLAEAIAMGETGPQLNSWFMEALFQTRRFRALRRIARQEMARELDEDHVANPLRDSVVLWATGSFEAVSSSPQPDP